MRQEDLSMPLLEQHLLCKKKNNDTVILHINHCMDNSFYFSSQLKRVFCDVVFVAVPYNNKDIRDDFDCVAYHAYSAEDGYHLYRDKLELELVKGSFLDATARLTAIALESEILAYARQGKRIIFVEDGGYHYDIIADMVSRHPVLGKAIIGAVEQTTSGTRKSCFRNSLTYPVVSVSRSKYKVRIESYFVANRVIDGLTRLLHEMDAFLDFRRILMLGYGIIGRSVALCLKSRNMNIHVFDLDDDIQETAVNEGFSLWDGIYHDNMIVLGNSGERSFTMEMLDHFLAGEAKRIVLASSSSKQTEFEAIFPFLKSCRSINSAHSTTYTFENEKEIVLLADGYPLNFVDESQDSLTFNMIDPVFTEIYLLIRFLKNHRGSLGGNTYLLGANRLVDDEIDENALVKSWMEINGLQLDLNTFNRHPNEAALVNHVLLQE